ncbi:hypothetical protein C5167_027776 [Papaver somniferum]|uniref:alpha carbonic anhydrase 7-like n=1 Tax=Papaver somniferum TaxID=3469 RepID=UPI000E6FCEAF|nr:alpha carbonic anhydrase 7-like [Papaver somniferum]RZC91713.1 hypothetical protein C5167_027776 [Papaver somniferum]
MKSFLSAPTLVFLLVIGVLVLNSRPTSSWLEVEDQTEFSYIPGSPNGPENWGKLHKDWAICNNGTKQSPIDIVCNRMISAPWLRKLKKLYKPSSATLTNRGHDIELQWDVPGSAGFIKIYGTIYTLDRVHWHSPSEHTINGKRYDLELHMVHKNVRLQKVAVVAVLYKICSGCTDSFLSMLESAICEISAGTEKKVSLGLVDPNDIDVGSREYYRYKGSLTTPPCTEGVIWTIKKQVMTVSKEQVMSLRIAVHDGAIGNARPLQAINNRHILYYHPWFQTTSPLSTADM